MTPTGCMIFHDAQKWLDCTRSAEDICDALVGALLVANTTVQVEAERSGAEALFENQLRAIYPLEAADRRMWR